MVYLPMYLPYKSTKCRYTYNSPMDPVGRSSYSLSRFSPEDEPGDVGAALAAFLSLLVPWK